ncbi:BON domain-containing protein [Caballeronia glebae]|uniref:BON domain-containing protein n=1 Tax=Caballeronia glebae TaxID=1777143 RepID=UPI0038B9479E
MSTMTTQPAQVPTPDRITPVKAHLAAEGSPQSDNALFVEAINALRQNPHFASESVLVDVHEGRVTLRGYVGSYARKLAACEIIKALPEVASVDDRIVVELPPDARRTDAALASDVHTALKWEACVPADAIDVSVAHGCVTLTGEIPWSFQRTLAEHAVARLSGITGVVNLLRVSDRQTQMQATTAIHAALRQAADIEADDIEVLVADGTVTLRGTVTSPAAKETACEAVRSLDGIHTVRDEIRIPTRQA